MARLGRCQTSYEKFRMLKILYKIGNQRPFAIFQSRVYWEDTDDAGGVV